MHRRIVCLYIIFLFSGSVKAQLAATIVDKTTGIPLSDASISLQNMRDKTTSKALTKDSGFFNFDNIIADASSGVSFFEFVSV